MKHPKRLWYEFFVTIAAFALLVVSVSLLWRNNLLLSLIMLVEGGVALRFWHDRYDLSFVLVIGGMGSLAEAAFVRSGAWHYANPSFLGVPLWFPIAFGTAGLIGGRLARALAASWEEVSPSRAADSES
jgi:hypothetical protein